MTKSIVTTRIRRMTEGNVFSLSTTGDTHLHPIILPTTVPMSFPSLWSHVPTGQYPSSRWGYPSRRLEYPSPVLMGLPQSHAGGTTVRGRGYHSPRHEVPQSQVGVPRTGVPFHPGQDWGTSPPPLSGQDRSIPHPHQDKIGVPPNRSGLGYPPPPLGQIALGQVTLRVARLFRCPAGGLSCLLCPNISSSC